jgi:hypothetical protein
MLVYVPSHVCPSYVYNSNICAGTTNTSPFVVAQRERLAHDEELADEELEENEVGNNMY